VISKPTTPQLIDAACVELETKVAPAIVDGTVRVVLDMAVAVLRTAAVRSAIELAWMREEADAIQELSARFIDELPDGSVSALADALRAYSDAKSSSLYLADVQADYGRASEVLSCAAELAYADGDPQRKAAITRLFDQRMAHENAVTGVFQAVGRG
jgi:hypothetical protein